MVIRRNDSTPDAVPPELCGLVGRERCKQTQADPRQEGLTEGRTVLTEKRAGEDRLTEQAAGNGEDRERRVKRWGPSGEPKSFILFAF